MKIILDSLSFLLQVFVVACVASLGWNLVAGFMVALTEHLRNRLLASRIRRQANETLETMKRAGDADLQPRFKASGHSNCRSTITLQDACCSTYLITGGMEHAERCMWRSRAAEMN